MYSMVRNKNRYHY